jgi:hypothetical protein
VAWLALAASPSLLFLAVTNQLTQNVAPIPFLWVLPLTLYLLSLILCFEGRRWYRRGVFLPLLPLALFAMAFELYRDPARVGIATLISVYAGGLFVCCMVCHGELARKKPDARHLTAFYVMLSLGGAVGGLFVALVAPLLFTGYFELPLGLLVCAALALAVIAPELLGRRAALAQRAALARLRRPTFGVAIALTLALGGYVAAKVHDEGAGARLMTRDFYGVLIVSDTRPTRVRSATRKLTNGTIDHGEQFLSPALRRQPTTWYGPTSGVGVALSGAAGPRPRRVGVVGLGAGTIATYGPGSASCATRRRTSTSCSATPASRSSANATSASTCSRPTPSTGTRSRFTCSPEKRSPSTSATSSPTASSPSTSPTTISTSRASSPARRARPAGSPSSSPATTTPRTPSTARTGCS